MCHQCHLWHRLSAPHALCTRAGSSQVGLSALASCTSMAAVSVVAVAAADDDADAAAATTTQRGGREANGKAAEG